MLRARQVFDDVVFFRAMLHDHFGVAIGLEFRARGPAHAADRTGDLLVFFHCRGQQLAKAIQIVG
jgi:hypothetical protein